MKFLYLIIIFSPLISSKQIEIKCPQHCKCDIFETLRRATCTHKNIVNVESHIPQQTQILDLSNNQITELNNYVFKDENLLGLKLFNVSHNKIGEIAMYAFDGLTQLKTLDLSYNGMHFIMKHWFFTLTSLEELYLTGNSFSKIDTGPLFTSNSLKKLDLSKCAISYVQSDTFWNVPNLETLDLSENYLIQIKADTIRNLSNLNTLNIDNKDLSKDDTFQELKNLCLKRGIRLVTPFFEATANSSEKFQKIVNMAPPEDEQNSWLFEDGEPVLNTTIVTCNVTHFDKGLLQEIIDLSPILSIIIPFFYGIAVGIVAVYAFNVFWKRKNGLESAESTYINFEDETPVHTRRNGLFRSMRSLRERDDDRRSLALQEWVPSDSTPVPLRREFN